MLSMDFIAEIRRRHFISGESISSIALSLKLSRTTVRKHLKTIEEPVYQRKTQSFPKLGGFEDQLKQWLETAFGYPKSNEEQLSAYLKVYRQKAIGVPMTACNDLRSFGRSNRKPHRRPAKPLFR